MCAASHPEEFFLPETPDMTILRQILQEFNGSENALKLTKPLGHRDQFFTCMKFIFAKSGRENLAH
jgi:hypothetical protein